MVRFKAVAVLTSLPKFTTRARLVVTGAAFGLLLPMVCASEIYKWVDAKGQVHFSDKRYAADEAERIDADYATTAQNGNQFLFYPEADVLLRQSSSQAMGQATALSAGNWTQGGTRQQTVSLLRFDISPLLAAMNQNPTKKILRASLRLFANGDDKLYGQGVNNQEAAGHSASAGDNAFYLKPVHNNFEENSVTWEQYFNQTHYTPSAIRNLPSISVAGSATDNQKNYEVDVSALMQQMMAANLRQLTLEMRLQRTAARAQVTFFSREAELDKRPLLQVDLYDEAAEDSTP